MRKLIYIPIFHSCSEVSPFGDPGLIPGSPELKQAYEGELSKYWDQIESFLKTKMPINRVYQDLLINLCIQRTVFKNIRKTSRNYNLLFRLEESGAVITDTENLFIANSHLRYPTRANLEQRDEYVAKTIDSTLQENEKGVLFMGKAHLVDRILRKYYPEIELELFSTDTVKLEELCMELSRLWNKCA